MINEYLFLSDEHKEEVSALKFDDIISEVYSINDAKLWIVSYSAVGNGEKAAEKLSDVHNTVVAFSPKVLTCESSEYFNKILYPYVNKFERKLRKLVYLAASLSGVEDGLKNIGELERKDFGEIFNLLFTDHTFINELKARVNAAKGSRYEGKSQYAKSEIIEFINGTDEDTLWDKIFDADDVPILKKRFRDIQSYRNDIMHAHNIDKELYGKMKYLFNKINDELDIAIGKRIDDCTKQRVNPKVNAAISSALQEFYFAVASNYFQLPGIEAISRALLQSPEYIEIKNKLNDLKYQPDFMGLERLNNALMVSPEYIKYYEAIENLRTISQGLDIFRRNLDALNLQIPTPENMDNGLQEKNREKKAQTMMN